MPVKRFKIFKRGFTLVEILIVVGITSVLSSMILTYTSSSRDQVALYVEQAKFAQTVSRAKSLALSIYSKPGEGQIPCGYGVEVDYNLNEYALFSYTPESCYSGEPTSENTEEINRDRLSHNIKFLGEDGGMEDAIQRVLFIAPDPKTWIWHEGKLATSTNGHVYLRTPQGKGLGVEIGVAGQISF